jgi:hypothetical protein
MRMRPKSKNHLAGTRNWKLCAPSASPRASASRVLTSGATHTNVLRKVPLHVLDVLPMDRDGINEQTDTMSSDNELMCVDLAATQSASPHAAA